MATRKSCLAHSKGRGILSWAMLTVLICEPFITRWPPRLLDVKTSRHSCHTGLVLTPPHTLGFHQVGWGGRSQFPGGEGALRVKQGFLSEFSSKSDPGLGQALCKHRCV